MEVPLKAAKLSAVAFVVFCGCSSSSPPTTATDSGTSSGSDTATGTETATGDGCSGTYSGAVNGTISCSSPLLVNKDLALSGTLSGSDVTGSIGISLKGTDN
ncbi:MAG: hypothetical protein ACXVEF_16205, partial [Polyangiales bacterium]